MNKLLFTLLFFSAFSLTTNAQTWDDSGDSWDDSGDSWDDSGSDDKSAGEVCGDAPCHFFCISSRQGCMTNYFGVSLGT